MNPTDRIAAEATANVTAWPTLSPAARTDFLEFAIITPRAGMAELSWRGVDRFFATVFDALDQAAAMGIPAERVRVQPFEPTAMPLDSAARVL